jgi:uncharacterized phage infection (PIP) family protein YhgE
MFKKDWVTTMTNKLMLFLMAAVIYCSTELKWATSAIMDSIKVTAVPTVSTSFSDG